MTEEKKVRIELSHSDARLVSAGVVLATSICLDKASLVLGSMFFNQGTITAMTAFLALSTGVETRDELLDDLDKNIENIIPKFVALQELCLNIVKQTDPEHADRIDQALANIRERVARG